jgi:photosystem II stability/assembly factor-like uncharacterized protein
VRDNLSMKTVAATLFLLSLPCHAADNAWSQLLAVSRDVTQIVSDHRLGRIYVVTEDGTLNWTADGGVTWETVTRTSDPAGATRTLAIDPLASNIVYRAAEKGLFKTTNHGVTWRRIDSGFRSSPARVTLAPDARETVYVTMSGSGGFMKSEDGGKSWDAVIEGERINQFVAGRDDTLYIINNVSYPAGRVFKSSNGGDSWIPVVDDRTLAHNWVVSPHDSQTIYVTAQPWGSRYLEQRRSPDGGRAWTRFQPIPAPGVSSIIFDPHDRSVLFGTDGRNAMRSGDGGASFQYLSTGLPEGSWFTALTLDGDTLLAGVRGKTPGTTGVYEYTISPPARRRPARR